MLSDPSRDDAIRRNAVERYKDAQRTSIDMAYLFVTNPISAGALAWLASEVFGAHWFERVFVAVSVAFLVGIAYRWHQRNDHRHGQWLLLAINPLTAVLAYLVTMMAHLPSGAIQPAQAALAVLIGSAVIFVLDAKGRLP